MFEIFTKIRLLLEKILDPPLLKRYIDLIDAPFTEKNEFVSIFFSRYLGNVSVTLTNLESRLRGVLYG